MISRSTAATPARDAWIDAATRRPAATASMIVLGPDTTSPPANTPGRPVADVRGSVTIPAQPLLSTPAARGRIEGSGSSPIATRTVEAGRSTKASATGSYVAA